MASNKGGALPSGPAPAEVAWGDVEEEDSLPDFSEFMRLRNPTLLPPPLTIKPLTAWNKAVGRNVQLNATSAKDASKLSAEELESKKREERIELKRQERDRARQRQEIDDGGPTVTTDDVSRSDGASTSKQNNRADPVAPPLTKFEQEMLDLNRLINCRGWRIVENCFREVENQNVPVILPPLKLLLCLDVNHCVLLKEMLPSSNGPMKRHHHPTDDFADFMKFCGKNHVYPVFYSTAIEKNTKLYMTKLDSLKPFGHPNWNFTVLDQGSTDRMPQDPPHTVPPKNGINFLPLKPLSTVIAKQNESRPPITREEQKYIEANIRALYEKESEIRAKILLYSNWGYHNTLFLGQGKYAPANPFNWMPHYYEDCATMKPLITFLQKHWVNENPQRGPSVLFEVEREFKIDARELAKKGLDDDEIPVADGKFYSTVSRYVEQKEFLMKRVLTVEELKTILKGDLLLGVLELFCDKKLQANIHLYLNSNATDVNNIWRRHWGEFMKRLANMKRTLNLEDLTRCLDRQTAAAAEWEKFLDLAKSERAKFKKSLKEATDLATVTVDEEMNLKLEKHILEYNRRLGLLEEYKNEYKEYRKQRKEYDLKMAALKGAEAGEDDGASPDQDDTSTKKKAQATTPEDDMLKACSTDKERLALRKLLDSQKFLEKKRKKEEARQKNLPAPVRVTRKEAQPKEEEEEEEEVVAVTEAGAEKTVDDGAATTTKSEETVKDGDTTTTKSEKTDKDGDTTTTKPEEKEGAAARRRREARLKREEADRNRAELANAKNLKRVEAAKALVASSSLAQLALPAAAAAVPQKAVVAAKKDTRKSHVPRKPKPPTPPAECVNDESLKNWDKSERKKIEDMKEKKKDREMKLLKNVKILSVSRGLLETFVNRLRDILPVIDQCMAQREHLTGQLSEESKGLVDFLVEDHSFTKMLAEGPLNKMGLFMTGVDVHTIHPGILKPAIRASYYKKEFKMPPKGDSYYRIPTVNMRALSFEFDDEKASLLMKGLETALKIEIHPNVLSLISTVDEDMKALREEIRLAALANEQAVQKEVEREMGDREAERDFATIIPNVENPNAALLKVVRGPVNPLESLTRWHDGPRKRGMFPQDEFTDENGYTRVFIPGVTQGSSSASSRRSPADEEDEEGEEDEEKFPESDDDDGRKPTEVEARRRSQRKARPFMSKSATTDNSRVPPTSASSGQPTISVSSRQPTSSVSSRPPVEASKPPVSKDVPSISLSYRPPAKRDNGAGGISLRPQNKRLADRTDLEAFPALSAPKDASADPAAPAKSEDPPLSSWGKVNRDVNTRI